MPSPLVHRSSSSHRSGRRSAATSSPTLSIQAGLPAGVFQMVHGGSDVGAALTTDSRVRAVSFTGSVATGRIIARAAAEDFKALQLELGGNNPVIVRQDANIEETAAALAEGMVKLNGQWCEGPGKVFVPRAIHDSRRRRPCRQAPRSSHRFEHGS